MSDPATTVLHCLRKITSLPQGPEREALVLQLAADPALSAIVAQDVKVAQLLRDPAPAT